MKVFDIDVSGEDLLSKDYVICVADKNNLIKGFKISEEFVREISSKFGQRLYRYPKSKKGKADLKVRIYCVIIYYLFKTLNVSEEISLNVCRDFDGKENGIRQSFYFFLEKLLGLNVHDRIHFVKLEKDSNAHQYAYLMRKDKKNQLQNYINITIEDIEKWLK